MCSLILRYRLSVVAAILIMATAASSIPDTAHAVENFEGKFYAGQGDVEYMRLLDISRRMFSPDPEFQNIAMLYTPSWNGLVEGPTWGAWWIQNSYGPTYCGLPAFEEPLITFLQNAQDLFEDPQIKHREHFKILEHQEIGPHSYHSPAYTLSKTPCKLVKAGPTLGEDNEYVFKEILGFTDNDIEALLIEGVITTDSDLPEAGMLY